MPKPNKLKVTLKRWYSTDYMGYDEYRGIEIQVTDSFFYQLCQIDKRTLELGGLKVLYQQAHYAKKSFRKRLERL